MTFQSGGCRASHEGVRQHDSLPSSETRSRPAEASSPELLPASPATAQGDPLRPSESPLVGAAFQADRVRRLWSGEDPFRPHGTVALRAEVQSGLIVQLTPAGARCGHTAVFYLPRPEHALLFSESAASLEPFGPSEQCPGAVGGMRLELHAATRPAAAIDPRTAARDEPLPLRLSHLGIPSAEISELQGYYRSRRPPGLDAVFERRYGGWKYRLLEWSFVRAEGAGCPVVLITYGYRYLHGRAIGARSNERSRELFENLAQSRGYRVTNAWWTPNEGGPREVRHTAAIRINARETHGLHELL